MPYPFSPGLTEPKIVDLTDPSDDLLLGFERQALTDALRKGDLAALGKAEGTWAAFAQEGVTIRLARTIGRPLRYFVAKRETGPYLVVADRIDAIARYCEAEGISWQFHPSYTRLAPAHCVTELDQIGCPDPNPRYRRFFQPEVGCGPADVTALGREYVASLSRTVERVLDEVPEGAPMAVALSGGADSTAVAAVLARILSSRGELSRLALYSLSIGASADAPSARRVAAALGLEDRFEVIDAQPEELDLESTVRCLEDYRPLDVACGAVARVFLAGLRRRRPDLGWIFDGDGGDENWKSYPVEDSDLTIKSVLNNPLLYHEGWGVDSIKHSLTYSGGLSRGVVRGFAPAREFGFRIVSPHAMRPSIAAALAAPLRDLVGDSLPRLYALKGEVIRAGLGGDLPIAGKRRFQEGATAPESRSRLDATRARLRRLHEERFAPLSNAADREARPAPPVREIRDSPPA